jgi:hypothetical protein
LVTALFPADRRLDPGARLGELAEDDAQVFAPDIVHAEALGERAVREGRLGHDEDAARIEIQPVDDKKRARRLGMAPP